MTTNRRRERLLFKGCLLILWLEFALWTSVLATSNSFGNSLSIRTQSGNQKRLSNATIPEKNVTAKKVTSQKPTTQVKTTRPPTTKAITFLDDYGELPGVSHDYDDDDNDDTLTSTTTLATTPETLTHKTKEEDLLFEIAHPYLEFKQKSYHFGGKNNEADSMSLVFDSAPKGVNFVPVHREKRSQDLVPNPVQLAIEQLLFTDGGSGETTETEVSTTTITATSTATSSAPTTTTEPTTSTATTAAPTTTTAPTTSTATSSAPMTTTAPTTSTATTAAPTTTTAPTTSTTRTSTATTPTRVTTVTLPQRTTSQPISPTRLPIIDPEDAEKSLYFLIVIIITFSNDLNDHTSPMFMRYATEIEEKVDIAYTGCPGYKRKSVKVTSFRRATSTLVFRKYFLPLNSAIEPLQTPAEVINKTIADYNVTFETANLYQQPDEIVNYIKDNVTRMLESITIQNSSVIAPETEDLAHTQIKNITKAPCQDVSCDPCYVCREEAYASGNDTYARGICHYTCHLSTELCTIIDNTQRVWIGQCSCKDGYLPVGDSCTDERIVIGVSVGIACVLFLAFVIVVVVLCCRTYRKKKKTEDSDSETSSVNSQDHRRQLIAEQGVPRTSDLYENAASPVSQISQNDLPQRTILPLIVLSDEEEGDDNLPPEITQSPAFINFVPNLSNVDDSKQYTIARASISAASLHHSQSTNYDNSFF